MADAYHHAASSAKKWGGTPDDYLPIHRFFDDTKAAWADPRHRLILHNAYGVALAVKFFGQTITNSAGRVIPTRWIAEQHVSEDFGRIPTIQECLEKLVPEDWMIRGARTFSRTISLTDTPSEAPSA
jgi:hypothetical protein